MEKRNRFIAPERMGTWVVTSMGVALVALVLAVYGIREARLSSVVSQVEVIKLNQRLMALESKQAPPTAVTPRPAAPEAEHPMD